MPIPAYSNIGHWRIPEYKITEFPVQGIGLNTKAHCILEIGIHGLDVFRCILPQKQQFGHSSHVAVFQLAGGAGVASLPANNGRHTTSAITREACPWSRNLEVECGMA